MKECPNCGELLGDSVEVCFKCNYNFKLRKVVSWEETQAQREMQQKAVEEKNRIQNEQQQALKEKQKQLQSQVFTAGQSFVTTGYDFDDYNIIAYLGVISGSVVMGTGFFSELSASINDFFGTSSERFSDIISDAEQGALLKLVSNAEHVGGNAVIGVDFDYITFNNNMIGVIANGTSVLIEKKEEHDKI